MSDDSTLLRRWVSARDAEAFAELVRRHAGLIYGTCRRIIRDHHAAEDVAQDCLLEFARKAASVRSSVAGFLYALASTRARNRVRADVVRKRHERSSSAGDEADASGDDHVWKDVAPIIDAALAELPDEQRLPLVLHFLEGRPQTEVARELGCDQATVSRRITGGIGALRERLGRSGIMLSAVALFGLLSANAAAAAPPTLIAAAGKIAVSGIGAAHAAIAGQAATTALTWKIAMGVALLAGGVAAGSLMLAKPPPAPPVVAAAPTAPPRWSNGLPTDPNFFPIGVWMQSPNTATAYRDIGVNLFMGLWEGPTDDALSILRDAGMRTICDQNAVGLRHRDDDTIVGWLIDADPQSDTRGHRQWRTRDPSRPIIRLLHDREASWGFADGRRDPPESYLRQMEVADALGFQTYPMCDAQAPIPAHLPYVAIGVENLRRWSGDEKPVWAWIECTKIQPDSPSKPTPEQVRSEVWMALIHGARGFVYFCHAFRDDGEDDAALLHDPVMLANVAAINREVTSLAPVLNGPTLDGVARVRSDNPGVPIDLMVKEHDGARYVFAVAMGGGPAVATFTVPGETRAEVLGENREVTVKAGGFTDHFTPYQVHLYRIRAP